MSKAILKKLEDLILPDLKTYYQPTIIRTMWYQYKEASTDRSVEKSTHK